MLNIGTAHQAIDITTGHIVQDVWGRKITVFEVEVATGGDTVIFNPSDRPARVGSEERLMVLGHFNLGE